MSSLPTLRVQRETVDQAKEIFGLHGIVTAEHEHLLWEAFNCPGSPYLWGSGMHNNPLPTEGNLLLAVTGDSAADVWVAEQAYLAGYLRVVGDQRRQKWLCNENWAQRGRALGLVPLVQYNPGVFAVTNKMIANTMEAIVGAVQIAAGSKGVATLMTNMQIHLGSGLDAM